MVPRSVLERVFSLKLGNETATGFAIEVDGKQYVVTARHLLAGSPSLSNIEIFHDNKWSAVPFKIISVEPPQVDIAVPNSICLGNKRLLIK